MGAVIGAEVNFAEFILNLGKWFGYDVYEGDRIQFLKVVDGASYTVGRIIPPEDLLNQGDRAITTTRGEDDSPVILEGTYIDASQQFRFNLQRARRILFPVRSTQSRRRMKLAVPIIQTASEALTHLGRAIYRMAGQNVAHQFDTAPKHIDVTPGTVLGITSGDTAYEVKVTRMEIGPELKISFDAVNLFTNEDIELDGESGNPLPPYSGGAAPGVTAAPSIDNLSPSVGDTLTATPGTYTGSPTITRRWTADGVPISGATGTTYTVTSGDAGKVIGYYEDATANGYTTRATATPTAAVASGGGGGGSGHRYWRLYITANEVADETDIAEVQLWTGANGTGANVGLNSSGATWTASSQYDSEHGPEKVGDGSLDTADSWWSADEAPPHWLLCDLGSGNSAAVLSISITNPNGGTTYCPTDFVLQSSDDGSTFTDVLTVTGYSGWDGFSTETWNVP
jgi:hypothetical protein